MHPRPLKEGNESVVIGATPKLDRSAKKQVCVGASTQLMSNEVSGLPGTGITAMRWTPAIAGIELPRRIKPKPIVNTRKDDFLSCFIAAPLVLRTHVY